MNGLGLLQVIWGALVALFIVGTPVVYGVRYVRSRTRVPHAARVWFINALPGELFAFGYGGLFASQLNVDFGWRVVAFLFGMFCFLLAPIVWVRIQRYMRIHHLTDPFA